MKYLLLSSLLSIFVSGCMDPNRWILLPPPNYPKEIYETDFSSCTSSVWEQEKKGYTDLSEQQLLLIGDKNLYSLSPLESHGDKEFNKHYASCLLEKGYEWAHLPINYFGSELDCDRYHRYKQGDVNQETLEYWCKLNMGEKGCLECKSRGK